MAIKFEELLAAQEKLKASEEKPKSMSMDQLKELSGVIKGGAKAQAPNIASSAILSELKKHTSILQQLVKQVAGSGRKAGAIEGEVEGKRATDMQIALLQQIAQNTAPVKGDKKEEEKKPAFGLGAIGTALAVALGAIVGVVQGHLKAIKLFADGLAKVVKFFYNLLPQNVLNAIKGNVTKAIDFFTEIGTKIGAKASEFVELFSKKIMSFVEPIVSKFTGFFKNLFGEGSRIAEGFAFVKNAVTKFFEPIISGFKVIEQNSSFVVKAIDFVKSGIAKVMTFFNGIAEFFGTVATKFSFFSKIFGATAKIVSKLALPLTVIMTIWDTVKGAIEGFEKEGIVGAIKGAITGLVNSLIMAPLDMLKDAVSWIAEKFGFDEAAKFLDSFSFEDLYKKFVDAMFAPIDMVKNLFNSAVKFFQELEIPKIGFTIPVINKEVSIGPFRPFKSDSSKTDAAPQSSAPSATSAAPAASAPAAAAPAEAGPKTVKGSGVQQTLVTTPAGAAAAPPPATANTVYNQSANNAGAAIPQAPQSSNVVVAPSTTVNNTTNAHIMRIPTRNVDPTLREYQRRMYAY